MNVILKKRRKINEEVKKGGKPLQNKMKRERMKDTENGVKDIKDISDRSK